VFHRISKNILCFGEVQLPFVALLHDIAIIAPAVTAGNWYGAVEKTVDRFHFIKFL